ncbi:MAG: FlgD immunoglobulin-like domain containing protein [bacterium]
MKSLLTALVILIAYSVSVYAQTDTLVIKLKNNQIEKIAVSKIKTIKFENVTSVNEPNQSLSGLAVTGNYPNPFQEQTNIEFEISSIGNVEVIIYDNRGNQIQKLECTNCQIGKNSLPWNCIDKNNNRVESGTYYYEVRFNSEVLTKKMILVK